ncbi:MAG TPA: potassium channel family protein [Rhizomicrobium sp.]|nr:potassium channel family protein [Rhizomicrobium sp.]
MAKRRASILAAVVQRKNLSPFCIFLVAILAIPLFDAFGIAHFTASAPMPLSGSLPVGSCGVDDHTAAMALQIFCVLITTGLLVLSNISLFNYLIAIGGKHSDHPYDRHAAVWISLILFLCLIMLYAAVYFIGLPCLHVGYRQESFVSRIKDDFAVNVYFSAVTITTLGYGDISPRGHLLAEFTAAAEAINGLLAFGVFTGALVGFIATLQEEPGSRATAGKSEAPPPPPR